MLIAKEIRFSSQLERVKRFGLLCLFPIFLGCDSIGLLKQDSSSSSEALAHEELPENLKLSGSLSISEDTLKEIGSADPVGKKIQLVK